VLIVCGGFLINGDVPNLGFKISFKRGNSYKNILVLPLNNILKEIK